MNMEKQAICLLVMCMFGLIICDEGKTNTMHLYHYEGSPDVKIFCNGSNVIHVTDIHLTNHPTDCPRNMCNLTVSDRNHIGMCNGKSSCEIPIDELSPCIKDKGFYSVDYSCQKNVYCDFENGSYQWFIEENGWTIVEAKHQYLLNKDHTTASGIGHYMYIESSGINRKRFYSEQILGSANQCLEFYYHIYNTNDLIVLYIQHLNGTTIQEVKIFKYRDVLWERKALSIREVADYRILFEARGHIYSKFAVDDFSIIKGDCQEQKGNVLYCDFEDGACERFLEKNNWTFAEAKNQYPFKDHTTGSGKGHYIYVKPGNSNKSFCSKQIQGSSKQCLTFFYYANPSSGSIRLYIHNKTGAIVTKVLEGNTFWERKTVSINGVNDYHIVIEATGSSKWSAFAVDDISIMNRDCQDLRECDFEYDWCYWNGYDLWQRATATMVPSTDHTTTDSGYYVYMKASEMEYDDSAKLASPIFSGSGEMCFTFWYYMDGHQTVSVTAYIELNSNKSELLRIAGSRGQLWHAAYIDINVHDEFKIIIEGQRGDYRWTTYIAIDDIVLLSGKCKGIDHHQQTCKSVNENVELKACTNQYLSNIHVDFKPSKSFCRTFLAEKGNSFCNTSSDNLFCDVRNVVTQRPSCFNLTELMIEYTCSEISKVHIANQQSNDNDSTGAIIGAVIGLLLVVGAILGVVFFVHRRRGNLGTSKNKEQQSTRVAWHANTQESSSNLADPKTNRTLHIQTSNNGLATNRAANNPSYGQGYNIAASKQTTNKQDTEYMNIVLDPAETGIHRSNPYEYELASPVNENLDDNYAESGAGVYDISGNSRHKVKDNIYDHSVEHMYDTSNHGRQEDLGDYSCNHVFGKQTEDDYDIAGS